MKIPKYLDRKYSFLWESFRKNHFCMEEAVKVLAEKDRSKKEDVPVFLSELRKLGLLIITPDPEDLRKSIYTLKSREDVIKELFEEEKEAINRGEIETVLKKAADLIRTRVDYKFILVLLFLKRISDKWELEYEKEFNELLKSGLSEKESEEEAKKSPYHIFDIPEEFLWDNLRKNIQDLPENFSRALKIIAERNPDLRDALGDIDFIQFSANRENFEILRQLVELFSEKKLYNVSPDVLGDAYEWILKYFAPQKAKEGEVYTPREVIQLLVEILNPAPDPIVSVYDPASASNGMLIMAHRFVRQHYGTVKTRQLFLFGQEVNPKTLALGKMNLYIHDIDSVQVFLGDTLLYPKFKEEGRVKQFDIVIANPPWNQDGYDEEVLKKGEFWENRFRYGFPPRQSADWAWVQHMLASANEKKGKVGVVIDNGCLFRGGKEKIIRTEIIKDDFIECIILLPEKLFYNTGAPGAILILNRKKPEDRKGKILFINASSEYEQHPEVRKLNHLSEKNIKRITDAYKNFSEEPGFSRPVPISEIEKNEYNLNVTLYVFPEEPQEEIDVIKEWQELGKIEEEIKQVEKKIENYLKEIK